MFKKLSEVNIICMYERKNKDDHRPKEQKYHILNKNCKKTLMLLNYVYGLGGGGVDFEGLNQHNNETLS